MTGATRPLEAHAAFAALLAAAGLPIYIHAPKHFADTFGVGLASLGAVLFALRLVDLVQDPLLGWLVARLRARLALWSGIAVGIMAVSLGALFIPQPPLPPLTWFALCLTCLFSAWSFLSIAFYATGVGRAGTFGAGGHVRLAGWRETGALAGVLAAAVAPTVLTAASDAPLRDGAAVFGATAIIATLWMRGEWRLAAAPAAAGPQALRHLLSDRHIRALLLLAFVNAAPVAITSTLFLFFADALLGAKAQEGVLLLLFFLAAGVSAPLWSAAARHLHARAVLASGMALSVATFAWAATLGSGDVLPFAVICLMSGAALGADMVLLPAMFARRLGALSRVRDLSAQGFGLWAFASKFTLAFAAVLLLPALERAGLVAGTRSSPEALALLTFLYAVVPCALKLLALALLLALPDEDA